MSRGRPTLGRFARGSCLLAIVSSGAVSAQETSVTLTDVSLSADTVGIGDEFELVVTLRVPMNHLVHFPDSLIATDAVASSGPVTWEAGALADGSAEIRLAYRLLPFDVGRVELPGFEILAVGAGGSANANLAPLPGGSSIVSRGGVLGAVGGDATLERSVVEDQRVWVTAAFVLEDISAGLVPRAAADVIGSSWDLWSLGPALILAIVLLVWIVTLVRRRVALGRSAAGAGEFEREPHGPSARQAALAELDSIFSMGLLDDGRTLEFFERTSAVTRRYVESLEPAWGPHLTSSELVAHLERRAANGQPARDLNAPMSRAEIVKFGLLRPDTASAEGHWRALRDWVHSTGGIRQ